MVDLWCSFSSTKEVGMYVASEICRWPFWTHKNDTLTNPPCSVLRSLCSVKTHVFCLACWNLEFHRISSLALSGLCDQVDGGESCCPTSEDCPNLKGNPGELQLFLLSEFSGWIFSLLPLWFCIVALKWGERDQCDAVVAVAAVVIAGWVLFGDCLFLLVFVFYDCSCTYCHCFRWIQVLVLSSAAYWHLVPGRLAQTLVLQRAIQGASEGCDGGADSRSWILSLRPAPLICLR